ncbi:ABC transporter permease subunit [Paenibacillus sp. J5C_2022]|uniref:ABC transporter permease n=1 Tax=Paenibacillus sp. J5C2022 TaxID=2977129 RepID=UPI0021D2E5AA|nr:ABC transporter permease subunit [Paenibacillus sp. J5C2022]MCU6710337.1 ABC transporter permease subunit [Paenibacillus sp. J5C2022]
MLRTLSRYKYLYAMLVPVVAYYALFHYAPMYGAIIAFQDFRPLKGIGGSEWVGLAHFIDFFTGPYAWRLIRNTFMINLYELLFSFPAPIILALLLNEIRQNLFKRSIQTITYMPHFISIVVMAGIVLDFASSDGVINRIIEMLGGEKTSFMTRPEWFYPVYIISGIWQHVGWGSIIYLAALAGIDPTLYEAGVVDGAGRWRQFLHITLPGIAPTIIIMFILQIGSMMSIGFEKVLLLYNPSIYETADVIATYVYRKGLLELNYSFSAAVGIFNSIINFALLVFANRMSRKYSETSLW